MTIRRWIFVSVLMLAVPIGGPAFAVRGEALGPADAGNPVGQPAPQQATPPQPNAAVPRALPDLVVEAIEFKDIQTTTIMGKTFVQFNLHVIIKNAGTAPSPACEVELGRAASFKGKPTKFADPDVPALAPGARTTIYHMGLSYDPDSHLKYFTAFVDSKNAVKESDEANNTKIAALPGY